MNLPTVAAFMGCVGVGTRPVAMGGHEEWQNPELHKYGVLNAHLFSPFSRCPRTDTLLHVISTIKKCVTIARSNRQE